MLARYSNQRYPTLRFVHTPDERLLIPTVQMVWDHMQAILREID